MRLRESAKLALEGTRCANWKLATLCKHRSVFSFSRRYSSAASSVADEFHKNGCAVVKVLSPLLALTRCAFSIIRLLLLPAFFPFLRLANSGLRECKRVWLHGQQNGAADHRVGAAVGEAGLPNGRSAGAVQFIALTHPQTVGSNTKRHKHDTSTDMIFLCMAFLSFCRSPSWQIRGEATIFSTAPIKFTSFWSLALSVVLFCIILYLYLLVQ